MGWRKGEEEQSLFWGGSQDRMELRMRDSLLIASTLRHSSSSMNVVLCLGRDSQHISAQLIAGGVIVDSLRMALTPLKTDTFFIRIGQSGQSAIGAHEVVGFYRGPPLDWGWHEPHSAPSLAFTELGLHSDYFGGEPFVELLNTSSEVINLMGCTLSDPKSKKQAPRSTRLEPGKRLCLSSGRPVSLIPFEQWSQLPHFNQAGDTLWLLNPFGQVLACTHYRVENWGAYDPDWGYTLEKSCEAWACLDDFNWVASTLPGGSPGEPYPGQCEIDSQLLFDRLPLCLMMDHELSIHQPPNTWGYWDQFQVNKQAQPSRASGINRFIISDSLSAISARWCNGQMEDLSAQVQALAQDPHLILTEGFIGPYGLNQSFIELYNPCDSGLDIQSYRLEFRQATGLLLNLIPIGTLIPAVKAKSVILISENPQTLELNDKKRLSLWQQSWSRWPSGYQPFTIYLCSADLELDSLPWPENTLQQGRSLERFSRQSPWQISGNPRGMTPGEYRLPTSLTGSVPQISNPLMSETQPQCEIHCFSEQPTHRTGILYSSQGTPYSKLFDWDCPAGDFYFSIDKNSLRPISNALLLLYEQSPSGNKKYSFRLSRLD